MTRFLIQLADSNPEYLAQVRYALSFASEGVSSYDIDGNARLEISLRDGASESEVREKVTRLLERFADRKFGLKEVVHYKLERDLPIFDAWSALIDRRWITPLGPGHVLLRGNAARLHRVIEAKVRDVFAREFNAEDEMYPSTIQCKTLDRIAHFTSFPEHVDFVSHLREDVDVLAKFSAACREKGWSPSHHEGAMAPVDIAICPSCCYHCYEGMEGWRLEAPGRCTTMILDCHRYEAGNLTTMSRLRAFHMREVVWVGHPEYVKKSRSRADELQLRWAKEWELDCTYENANDMFFTDDFAVKASFQRQQEAKRELRLRIPFENKRISCTSSNFHASTFGKAFDIQVNGRPATSACMGWGCERWVYAVFSQFGLDETNWPRGLRDDWNKYLGAAS